MGCDGGTIPKRDELVRTKKKAEQKDKVSQRSFLWRHCNISQTPLHDPVVACGLGRLYNKDAVIMAILDKSTLPETAKHIKSLKDVKVLNLTENPCYDKERAEKGDQYVDHQDSPYICPVIGLEMNGKFKFCFSWECGCVVSERAINQIKSNLCHKCQKPISESEVVIMNPVDEDLNLMVTRMEARQARAKAEKKTKKTIVKESNNGETSTEQSSTSEAPTKVGNSSKLADRLTINKSVDKNGVKRSAVGLEMKADAFKKTKSSYSVAKDPQASTVYKSLFTSSHQAKNQMKAHWVTYNPFYN